MCQLHREQPQPLRASTDSRLRDQLDVEVKQIQDKFTKTTNTFSEAITAIA